MDEMDEIRITAKADAAMEAAVLRQLLALHPAQVSAAELLREIAGDPEDFSERDALDRAVRDLGAAGLVRHNGDLLLPSRAALRFDELLG
jgi:hypothetical protein